MDPLQQLINLLGAAPNEDVIKAFQRATPATAAPLKGMYFNPYMERVGLGEAEPFQENISLKDYINAVNREIGRMNELQAQQPSQ